MSLIGEFTRTKNGYGGRIRTLALDVIALQGAWQIFWILFYALATYGNAGFLREQICKYMCPYARFQSAMFDQDTLLVTYDATRGESRGPRNKSAVDTSLGDCIDCTLCVQVCPVGIDIRDGLQYECIGCGLCIDACNSVMDKMQYPRGLIRYTTANGLVQHWGTRQILRRVARPRVLLYGAALAILTFAMVCSLTLRTPFKVDIVRDRSILARLVTGGEIENVYQLQIANATELPQRYHLTARGVQGIYIASDHQIDVAAGQSRWTITRIRAPEGTVPAGPHPINLEITTANDASVRLDEKTTFLVPR